MFRKTWKTIKIIAVIAIVVICLPHSLLPKKENAESKKISSEHKKPGNQGSGQLQEKDTLELR